MASLLERLKWLLGELSSFETHFEKARFDAKIQLKREHDELLRAATTGRAIQTNGPDVDPWEDELISKVRSGDRFCLKYHHDLILVFTSCLILSIFFIV